MLVDEANSLYVDEYYDRALEKYGEALKFVGTDVGVRVSILLGRVTTYMKTSNYRGILSSESDPTAFLRF